MKHCFLVIVCLVALLAACGPGGDYACHEGVCIDLTIDGPVKYDEPATYTVRVLSQAKVDDLGVSLTSIGGLLLDAGDMALEAESVRQDATNYAWRLATEAGQEYVFRGHVMFPQPKELAYGASFQLTVRAVAEGVNIFDYVDVYYDAQGNWVDPAQRRSYTGEDILVPTIHPSITVLIPTPTATLPPPTTTPEPTPTAAPYPAPQTAGPGEGTAAPPEGAERAAPTVEAYPAP